MYISKIQASQQISGVYPLQTSRPMGKNSLSPLFGSSYKNSSILQVTKNIAGGIASVIAIPLFFVAPAYLTTRYDEAKLEEKMTRKQEISQRVSELAKSKDFSLTYLSGLIYNAIEKEPMFFKEKYWDEQVPILAEKAVKRQTEVIAGIKEKVRKAQQAKYEHKIYVKNLIISDEEIQNFLNNSKKAEAEFKRQNPNKKIFKTYSLNYSDCSGYVSGIITQINKIPLENNAKKVKVGTKEITRNVPSGVQTRFGVNLLRTEIKSVPIYETVYPNDIISFAFNDVENNCIEIRCYKK